MRARGSRLFVPFFLRAHAELHHRPFGGGGNARVAAAATPFQSRLGRKEMTHNPSASNHGDDAENREPDELVKIHRSLFSARGRDVKSSRRNFLWTRSAMASAPIARSALSLSGIL